MNALYLVIVLAQVIGLLLTVTTGRVKEYKNEISCFCQIGLGKLNAAS